MFRPSKNDTSSFDAHQYRKDRWLAGCVMAITSFGVGVAATSMLDDGKPKSFNTICASWLLFAFSYVGLMLSAAAYPMSQEHAREHDVSPRLRS